MTIHSTPHIKPLFVVFCDDIRQEVNGKQILIGVYAGDIILQSFPATIGISGWISFARESNVAAQIPIEFRIIDSNGRPLGYGSATLNLMATGQQGAIALPAVAIIVQKPDTLTLELKQYDEPWQKIGSIDVIRPISGATLPAQPASQSLPDAPQGSSPPEPSRPARPVRRRRS